MISSSGPIKKTETIVIEKREERPNVPMNIKVLQQNGDIIRIEGYHK